MFFHYGLRVQRDITLACAAGGKRALGTRTPCNPRAQGEPWESRRRSRTPQQRLRHYDGYLPPDLHSLYKDLMAGHHGQLNAVFCLNYQ